MLTSYPAVEPTFSNPVAVAIQKKNSPSDHTCLQKPTEKWSNDIPRTDPNPYPKNYPTKKAEEIKPPKVAMNVIEPEDDLISLINNDSKLGLCGYYYGNLSWVDASHMLRQCKVGTFLVRDSEHGSYLYTLSVQTRKGPTSCRIEYVDGRFRLDSSKDLSHKMPLFDCVTYLIDHYVEKSRYPSHRKSHSPVWLDMDEENTMDVPVQIYRPLYRQVRSLQHMCRVSIVKSIKDSNLSKASYCSKEDPLTIVTRTTIRDPQYKKLPTIVKDYLIEYPYSQ